MPCNCDHLGANGLEKEISRVQCLLDELDTGVEVDSSSGAWDGYHTKVYNKIDKSLGDKLTEELCTRLQSVDVTKYSFEMQAWWRDHLRADKLRIQKELNHQKDEEAKKAAIAKLTKHERKLLNLE